MILHYLVVPLNIQRLLQSCTNNLVIRIDNLIILLAILYLIYLSLVFDGNLI